MAARAVGRCRSLARSARRPGGKINIDVKGPPMGANRELRTYIAKVVGVLPIDVQVDPSHAPADPDHPMARVAARQGECCEWWLVPKPQNG